MEKRNWTLDQVENSDYEVMVELYADAKHDSDKSIDEILGL